MADSVVNENAVGRAYRRLGILGDVNSLPLKNVDDLEAKAGKDKRRMVVKLHVLRVYAYERLGDTLRLVSVLLEISPTLFDRISLW